MKKIKYLIGIAIIIVIIILVNLLINKNNREKKSEAYQQNEITEEGKTYVEKEQTLHDVDNTQDFFTAVNCVNQYYGALNQSVWGTQDSQEITEELKSGYRKNIYNLLSKKYVNENDINENNILNHVENIQENIFCIPLEMKMLTSKDGSTKKCIVYGIQENIKNEYIRDFYTIINIDTSNETFSIEPKMNKEYKNIDDITVDNSNISIENNNTNKITELNINDEYIVKQYTSYYKKLALGRPDISYKLMDKEYREKRFGSLEKYKTYIAENIKENTTFYMKQYLVNRDEETTQYVGKDQYGRLFVFNVVTPTKYKIQLDTYTILTDEFKKEYETEDSQKKVQMNLNRFILMINNQDYEAAYSVLDSNFKNNYFKNIEDFEKYIKTYAYRYNNMKIDSFDIKGNVYSCSVSLGDSSNGVYVDEEKGTGGSGYVYNWDFYMQLGENYDFTISFEVQK